MTEAEEVNVQNPDKGMAEAKREKIRMARRDFLRRSLAVTTGVALAEMLPTGWLEAAAQTSCIPDTADALIRITPITSAGGKLQAIMKVVNGNRSVPVSADKTKNVQTMLRYFAGYNPNDSSQKWPASPDQPGPGPTLRCQIGDVVQITLLNQVKVEDFGGSLDSGEQGKGNGCDQATLVNANGSTNKNWYPANDLYPNCLHGSSSANLHFHGTHVSPATTGDNVIINVRPNAKVTEKDVEKAFRKIFDDGASGHFATRYEQLPKEWREFQDDKLKEYDDTAPYQGGHGLPDNLKLLPQNKEAIAAGVWPQWYVGSYPNCFKIPTYAEDPKTGKPIGNQMGQAPGTHWYHSHKHGSTAINLFNGLSGALIITDPSPTGYDGKLQSFYNNKLKEEVLVFQQIMAVPHLLSSKGGPKPVLVNGQWAPKITMQPGEIRLFRMINATVQGFVNIQFNTLSGSAPIQYRQTAQDGVQLAYQNYSNPANGGSAILMAPANRVDLLVQAPPSGGCFVMGTANAPIVYIDATPSTSNPAINPPMQFPATANDYPVLPSFLKDIDYNTVRLRREVVYGWDLGTGAPGRAANGNPPQYTIDGQKFEDQMINQVMLLGATEEWTIINSTIGIAHPFHIHVNPFQVVEIFDPAKMTQPQKLSPPFVWWDTFAIPAGVSRNGNLIPGYFKMRTRFVDYTGLYVQHCHILAHEDRGMMQLLEVVPNKTILKHH